MDAVSEHPPNAGGFRPVVAGHGTHLWPAVVTLESSPRLAIPGLGNTDTAESRAFKAVWETRWCS